MRTSREADPEFGDVIAARDIRSFANACHQPRFRKSTVRTALEMVRSADEHFAHYASDHPAGSCDHSPSCRIEADAAPSNLFEIFCNVISIVAVRNLGPFFTEPGGPLGQGRGSAASPRSFLLPRNARGLYALIGRTKFNAGSKPMITWATIVALAAGATVYLADTSSLLIDLAELAGVIALFALVCAAEAYSEPKS